MTTELSIIIVHYRVYAYLDACLHSVYACLSDIPTTIWVVDNESNSIEQTKLAKKYPAVQWICTKENLGFAKANNLALQQLQSKYLLFLNPDTLVHPNVLLPALQYLKDHPMVGAVGVQMRNGNDQFLPESKRAIPSLIGSFFKLFGLAALFPKSSFFNQYALGQLDKDQVHRVPVLAGAFIMMPLQLAQQLNGFDESFFMYGEDIDLSVRILERGFENHYLGNCTITHFKGASSKQDSAYLRHFYASMIIFIRKYPTLYGGRFGVKSITLLIKLLSFVSGIKKKFL